MPIAGGSQVSVTGVVLLIVLAVKRSVPLIFGFCTGEMSGLTVAVGSAVVCVLTRLMFWILPPGTGTEIEALWHTRKVRLQAVGNGSLYCTVPASTSVVKGGFKSAEQGTELEMIKIFALVKMRSIGIDGFEGDTFGPSAAM